MSINLSNTMTDDEVRTELRKAGWVDHEIEQVIDARNGVDISDTREGSPDDEDAIE